MSGAKCNFSDVKIINLQLSNLCNYAHLHPKCPVHHFRFPEIMPAATVYSVIDQAAAHSYEGAFIFCIYNEPFNDPRLFLFTRYAKRKCPSALVFVLTNGSYLSDEMMAELPGYGLDGMWISLYTPAEKERLSRLAIPPGFYCRFNDMTGAALDGRLQAYETDGRLPRFCHQGAPLDSLQISSNGQIVLCCLDWRRKYVFGSVNEAPLAELINRPDFLAARRNLAQGREMYDLCRGCVMGSSLPNYEAIRRFQAEAGSGRELNDDD